MEGRRLLDIGGGIGVISAELPDTGVANVTMVEASPAYLAVARRVVESKYGSRPTQFILGDFEAIADTLPNADGPSTAWFAATLMAKYCLRKRLGGRGNS